MVERYYINGEDGSSFTDAVVHTDKQCAEQAGDGHARPVSAEHVDATTDRCRECAFTALEDLPEPESDREELIENGECPWCSEYKGDHVGQHASSAHPEEWTDYKEA
jgi:hypothetical protein